MEEINSNYDYDTSRVEVNEIYTQTHSEFTCMWDSFEHKDYRALANQLLDLIHSGKMTKGFVKDDNVIHCFAGTLFENARPEFDRLSDALQQSGFEFRIHPCGHRMTTFRQTIIGREQLLDWRTNLETLPYEEGLVVLRELAKSYTSDDDLDSTYFLTRLCCKMARLHPEHMEECLQVVVEDFKASRISCILSAIVNHYERANDPSAYKFLMGSIDEKLAATTDSDERYALFCARAGMSK